MFFFCGVLKWIKLKNISAAAAEETGAQKIKNYFFIFLFI